MEHERNHVKPNMVFTLMSAWLLGWVFSIASLGLAAEPLEELMPLAGDEFESAEGHLRLGIDFFLTNELDVAIDEFREAAHQQPDYPDAYHNLGVALAKIGDLTGAIKAWTEAERLDPQGASLRYSLPALVAYNFGVSLVRSGKIVEAMKEWQTALRLQPHFPEAHYALGLGFLAKQNPAVAMAHLQSALSFAPDWAQAYMALGQAHYESHEYDQARNVWKKGLDLKPGDAETYVNLGHVSVQEGNYQEAINFVRQAIALEPNLVPAHFHLGVALLAKGEVQASVDAFKQVLALDSRFPSVRLLLGKAWSRMGNWAQAAQSWRKGIQQDPFDPDVFWLHANLGMALTAVGHFQDATKEFEWVVEERPEWAEGWSKLGVSLMSERRWGEAVVALKTAAQLRPHWAHLHFTLGKAHAGQGELDFALEAFREAVRIAPNFVAAQFHLGIVLRAQNQVNEAIGPLGLAAEGGSREAQGLLASMYVNGHGIDRNVPLAMLWWSRSSRGSKSDTIARTAQNQLAQMRRRLHRQQFTPTEQEDVLTGFELIRQDLANHAPIQYRGPLGTKSASVLKHDRSPIVRVRWMVERALAMDTMAQEQLREWFVRGLDGPKSLHQNFLQNYWVQVAKEGDRVGCGLIHDLTPQENFSVVRQACLSLSQ